MRRSWLYFGASCLAVLAIVFGYFVWQAGLENERKSKALDLARVDFWEAEPTLRQCLVHHPDDVEILRVLAKGYVRDRRNREAEEALTQLLAHAPHETEALYSRLELFRELGRFDEALADADRLLEIDADQKTWRHKRLVVLVEAGRFPEAETECHRCLRKAPRDAGLLKVLAEIKRARGEYAAAGQILDSLLRESPRDAGALWVRAMLHLSQDEPEKSIPLFREVLKLDGKKQVVGRYNLALALSRVGQTEEAERLMEDVRHRQQAAVLALDSLGLPENLPLQMRNARAQFENNDLKKAAEIIRHVLSVDPSYAPAHALMAEVLEKQRSREPKEKS